MIKDKLKELFKDYEPGLQRIIQEVLVLEQENISMERPRVKEKVEDIIAREAKRQVNQEASETEE